MDYPSGGRRGADQGVDSRSFNPRPKNSTFQPSTNSTRKGAQLCSESSLLILAKNYFGKLVFVFYVIYFHFLFFA